MSEDRQESASGWLSHPALDVVVGAGAWSLPLLALTGSLGGELAQNVAMAFYALALVVNMPHYAATLHRAYRNPADVKAHALSMVWGTALIVAGLIAVIVKPIYLGYLFTVYLVWSPWHYSAQNQGIATLFLRRAGAEHDDSDRRRFRWGFIASYVLWILGMQSGTSTPLLLRLNLDPSWTTPARLVLLVVFLALVVPPLKKALATARQPKVVWGAIVVTSSQLMWFGLPWLLASTTDGDISPLYYATGALAFMHCAQYLWVVHATEKREHQKAGVRFRPGLWALGLLSTGAALFFLGPLALSHGLKQDLAVMLLAFQAAVNIHHFLIDGVIWKLREPRFKTITVADVDDDNAELADAELAAPLALMLAASVALVCVGGLGVYQHLLVQTGASQEQLDRANQLNPHDKRVELRLAQDLVQKNQLDAAIDLLVAAAKESPGNADLQMTTVRFLAVKEKTQQAYDLMRQQPEHFRASFADRAHLAAMALELNLVDDAERWMEAAAQLDAQHPEVHRYRAMIAQRRGDEAGLVRHAQAWLAAAEAAGLGHPLDQLPPDEDFVDLLLATAQAAREAETPELVHSWLHKLSEASVQLNRPDLAVRAKAEEARNAAGRKQWQEALQGYALALELSRHTHLPLVEGQLWMSFGALLEEARDISMQERFVVALKAKEFADELKVDDVDADLPHVVLKKNSFESLAKLQDRMPPDEIRVAAEQSEFIARRLLQRYARVETPPTAQAPTDERPTDDASKKKAPTGEGADAGRTP